MITTKRLSLGLFLVALSTSAMAQNAQKSSPITRSNSRAVIVEKLMEKYGEEINDDEDQDAEELNIINSDLNRSNCKTCYINRSDESFDSFDVNSQIIFLPRRD